MTAARHCGQSEVICVKAAKAAQPQVTGVWVERIKETDLAEVLLTLGCVGVRGCWEPLCLHRISQLSLGQGG